MVAPAHLKSLQALEMAIRVGSLNRAADLLGITPAAVGQRVKTLEDYLGVKLLERGRAGIRPTDELSTAVQHLRSAFAELEKAAEELDLQRGQEIHVAATSDLAELWLRPRLEGFRAAHPNILFCINGEGAIPPRLGKIDCEISYGPVREDDRHQLLFRDFVLPISSPINFERTARFPARTRLEGFPLLHLDFYRNDPAALSWPAWFVRNGIERTAPERGIRFQQIRALLDAVSANAGISLCGLALIADRIEDGSLALPYPVDTGSWTQHAFVAHFRGDASRPPVARFREWLMTESAATGAWLAEVAAGNRIFRHDR
jgi:LysR family glycine cleavage system transcriptional activator